MRHLKAFLLSLSVLAFAAASRADDFFIDGVGTLSLQVPSGWTVARQAQGTVLTLILSPKNQANAQACLAVSFSSTPLSATTEDQKFAAVCRQFAPKSVEQKATPKPYKLARGHGSYAIFTDARLVGQPSRPGDYKIVVPGLIQLNDFTEIFTFLGSDDADGPEMTALRSAVESIRLAPPGPPTVITSVPVLTGPSRLSTP